MLRRLATNQWKREFSRCYEYLISYGVIQSIVSAWQGPLLAALLVWLTWPVGAEPALLDFSQGSETRIQGPKTVPQEMDTYAGGQPRIHN